MDLANEDAMPNTMFDWDYLLWEVRLFLVVLGFFFYLGVFLLSHLLSSWISVTYRTFSSKEKVFWNIKVTRGVFGLQSWVSGLWALLIDPVFQADKVYSQQKWSWFTCLIASGFFLLENVAVHLSNFIFKTFDAFVVVHHFLAFVGLLGLILNTKSGHYLPLMGMLLEMSTPTTCISWLLLKAGYSHTIFWKANQWLMIHLFHCRMMLTYHMWWVCISNWNDVVENLGLLYFIVLFLGLASVSIILNPYWTYKKTMQVVSPTDRNFPHAEVKNGQSGKLNGETIQKKRI
ncbi:protein CLN8-like [Alligator sinensis]|uniref:Protein CLN8-like n=1 Tax=Alligator sinensis TaxID=38654 RepID=A0A3Q0GQR9_ALLSI|nr:protein CLN8-like [Alligator sinensis]